MLNESISISGSHVVISDTGDFGSQGVLSPPRQWRGFSSLDLAP